MRIAIIGSGIAGMTACYRLDPIHDITLFEANDYLGGHTHTVDVQIDGESHAIDTGFIVFNDLTYPNFVRLLSELGIDSRPTSMSFSVRCEQTGLEYNGSSLNQIFTQRSNAFRPRFLRMLADIARFNREAPSLVLNGKGDDAAATVAEFVHKHRYSEAFVEHYLFPLGSAVWSCPASAFGNFPIRFVVEFYHQHGLTSWRDRPTWRVIQGGSRTYVEAIRKRLRGRVLLNAPVQSVRRLADGAEIRRKGAAPQKFDHVIFACHADQALRLLADPSPTENELLRSFPYQRNTAVLHTDTALLPRSRRAWASWNYLVAAARNTLATVTYCMNILQHIESRHVFSVSLNSEDRIDPRKVLGQWVYEHPVFDMRRAAAQSRHHEVIDVNHTSFCGAYWRNGFHEDGVVSALAVCRKLNPVSDAAATPTLCGDRHHRETPFQALPVRA